MNDLSVIVSPLVEWYRTHARDLPWRHTRDPYRIWVSEIMLQQTRVEAVIPYYERFLEAFPTIRSLAEGEERLLLKLWEGLGYYSRAKNLQKAARQVVSEYGGCLPADPEKLKKLPGIGAYTCGSISSIAFDLPVPAVDGNVLRVITRITGSRADITLPATKKEITSQLRDIFPQNGAGDFTQSLMELGALVCLPNGQPLCEQCPVFPFCLAGQNHLTDTIPVKPAKAPRKVLQKTVLLLCCGSKTAIRQRPSKGLLASLWEFPSLEGRMSLEECREILLQKGYEIDADAEAVKAKHVFTHQEWQMDSFLFRLRRIPDSSEFLWAEPDEIETKYPIPSAFKAFWDFLSCPQISLFELSD